MSNQQTMAHKRDLILADEKQFAARVSVKVIDKPRLDVWMILIPVFFIFYFWQLKRYAKGRKTFAENFLITRQAGKPRTLRRWYRRLTFRLRPGRATAPG